MKKLLKKFKLVQSGFTLIELLVVIGILGILAAALLATIDPLEQIKKAQDESTKQTATEFLNANVRYYGTHNALPWPTCYAGSMTGGVLLSALGACTTALITDGELKGSFTSANNLSQITVTNPAASTDVIVCFQPQSKAGQEEANTKFTATGGAGTTCKSTQASGGNNCYWCAQ